MPTVPPFNQIFTLKMEIKKYWISEISLEIRAKQKKTYLSDTSKRRDHYERNQNI